MTSVGSLTVRARYETGRIAELRVDLERPPVTRLFVGQLPDVVIKTVPYLFTLCAQAQRTAAQAAVNAALGETPREREHAALWMESLHEHLWRLLLDWPPASGLPPAKEAFVAWRTARHEADGLAVTRRLVDEIVRPLAEACLAGLDEHETGATAPRHPKSPEDWLDYWRGMRADMPAPPLPPSVGAVLRARLGEVETALDALTDGHPFPVALAGADGWGVGQTCTARGVLTHAVHVVDGRVARYRVQAPTDALFADAAPLSALLAGRAFATADEARQATERAILALDPCLPYQLEVHDA